MTYNVFSGTLNPTQSQSHQPSPLRCSSMVLILHLFWKTALLVNGTGFFNGLAVLPVTQPVSKQPS